MSLKSDSEYVFPCRILIKHTMNPNYHQLISFDADKVRWKIITAGPGRPGNPANPRGPTGPCLPVGPSAPGEPGNPVAPSGPRSPSAPLSPG
jgi:hypothetical protein